MPKTVLALFSFIAGAFTIYSLERFQSYTMPCSDEIIREEFSPNEVSVAIFYIENCGATSDYASAVKIAPARAPMRFEIEPFLSLKGRADIDLVWIGGESLSVEIKNDLEVSRKAVT